MATGKFSRSLGKPIRFILLFAPLLMFCLASTSPYYSERLSLILHGRPFARVVPKEKLDISQYVSTDNFACRAIVFSHGKAVGWIFESTLGGFPEFVAFTGKPDLVGPPGNNLGFNDSLMFGWVVRWWLLPAQLIMLVWFLSKQKPLHHSTP